MITKFGFIKLTQSIDDVRYINPRFINGFVKEQLLNGGAMIKARYVQVITGAKPDPITNLTWVIRTEKPGIFHFDTDFAMSWYLTRYSSYPPESFFFWLLIECLTALRGNFIADWSIGGGNFITHRNFQELLSEDEVLKMREGNYRIADQWRRLPDCEVSGKSLLQDIDRWTFNFMFNWILRKDISWINKPEELALLVQAPVPTTKAIVVGSRFSLPALLKAHY